LILLQRQTLTVPETAEILGISRNNAYNMARKGYLPGVRRLGKRYLVSKPELDQYLAGEKT